MPQHLITADIANNVTTSVAGKVLDARQGTYLRSLFDQSTNNNSTGGLGAAQVNALIAAKGPFVDVFDPQFGSATANLNKDDTSPANLAAITANTQALQAAIDYAIYNPAAPSKIVNFGGKGTFVTDNTLFQGYGDIATSSVLFATNSCTSDINNPAKKGVTVFCIKSDRPALNVQGVYNSSTTGINFQGLNTLPSSDYGNWMCDGKNWVNPRLHVNADSETACYFAITVDAFTNEYQGNDPNRRHPNADADGIPYIRYPNAPTAAPSTVSGTANPYYRANSSDYLIDNCTISNFVGGIGVHPCGRGGQGEFLRFSNTHIVNCKYGVSMSNSQARLTDAYRLRIDFTHTALLNKKHGLEKLGRFSSFTLCHFSVFQVMDIGYMPTTMVFNNCYSEAACKLGFHGTDNSNYEPVVMNQCNWSFDQHTFRHIPINLWKGQSITFNQGNLGGLNCDLKSDYGEVVINGTTIEIRADREYDSVMNWNEQERDNAYTRWSQNYPFSTGNAKFRPRGMCKVVFSKRNFGGESPKIIDFVNKPGSNSYPAYNFKDATGFSGIKDDYFKYRSLYGSDLTSKVLSGLRFTFNLGSSLGLNNVNGIPSDFVKGLVQPGGVFEFTRDYDAGGGNVYLMKGVKFLVTRRGTLSNNVVTNGAGEDVECVLLNGFEYYLEDNRFYSDTGVGKINVTTGSNTATVTFSSPQTLKAGVIINTVGGEIVGGGSMVLVSDITNSTTGTVRSASGGNFYGSDVLDFNISHVVSATSGSQTVNFSKAISLKYGEQVYIRYSNQVLGYASADTNNSTTAVLTNVPPVAGSGFNTVSLINTTVDGQVAVRHLDRTIRNYLFGMKYSDMATGTVSISPEAFNPAVLNAEMKYVYNNYYNNLPIGGTASPGSNVITGVSFSDFNQNNFAGNGNAEAGLRVNSLVYIYTYANHSSIPTSKAMAFKVISINESTHEITLDRNTGLAGTVLVYNRWPYHNYNELPNNDRF